MRLNPNANRRGVAPLEMVLALPLLVFLAAMILTIGRVGIARLDANFQARRDAWARPVKNGAAEAAPLPAPLGGYEVILASGSPRGLASGAVDKQTPLAPMLRTSIPVRTKVFVLLDPLDHVAAPFPFHARLTPDRRAIRLGTQALSDLANLGNLESLAGDGAGKMTELSSHMDQLAKEGEALEDRRREVIKEIGEVSANKDLTEKEKKEKLEKLAKELKDIEKARKGLKEMDKQYGGLGR